MSLFTGCPNLFLLEQVVDLSNNALTTILPIMIIALELPHLEADLADNQWHCDKTVAAFQIFISESWRKKWNVICNKAIGKSIILLLSEELLAELKKAHKSLIFETMTARVLIHGISQPWAVS